MILSANDVKLRVKVKISNAKNEYFEVMFVKKARKSLEKTPSFLIKTPYNVFSDQSFGIGRVFPET